ncbi:MAG: sulfatase-like hydrolase/transferase [Candidatus Kapaibacterium sp.]
MLHHLLLAASLSCILAVPALAQRNILLIIADDLSPDYLGCFRSTTDTAVTPVIRSLAERGIRFTNVWSTPLCSPTRSEILTGRYPFRTGIGSVVAGMQATQLDTGEVSLPRVLKRHPSASYATADIGKWHLHLGAPPIQRTYPNVMGYDLYSGNFSGMLPDYYKYPRIRNGVVDTVKTYATTQTVSEAIEWIGSVAPARPFFCWLAFNAPHVPFHVPPASLCDTKGLVNDTNVIKRNAVPYFKAMVQAMDTEIGRLLAFLESKGLRDNTDIIFIGDNGNASQVAQNVDPKKAKATCYHYGVHVPLIVAGPSVVKPGRTNASLINATDLFATIPELCSYAAWRESVPGTTTLDAVSFLPVIKDEAAFVRTWAFSEQFTKPAISADAKTIRNERYQLLRFDTGSEEFYDLIADTLENTDLLLGTLSATQKENYDALCSRMKTLTGVGSCQTVSVPLSPEESVVTVHPNPATSHFRLRGGTDIRRIVVTDLQGREREVMMNEPVSIAELGAGTYMLRIIRSDGSETLQTLVVAR